MDTGTGSRGLPGGRRAQHVVPTAWGPCRPLPFPGPAPSLLLQEASLNPSWAVRTKSRLTGDLQTGTLSKMLCVPITDT